MNQEIDERMGPGPALRRGAGRAVSLVLAMLPGLSGCLFAGDEGDGGFGVSPEGIVQFQWGIRALDDPPSAWLSCVDAGVTGVALRMRRRGDGYTASHAFDCALGAGALRLPPGDYAATLDLTDAAGQVLSTVTPADAAAGAPVLVRAGARTDIQTVFLIQSFVLTWSIEVAGSPGTPVTCAAASATLVRLDVSLSGAPQPVAYEFPCVSLAGSTTAIPGGFYTVALSLLDGARAPLSATAPMTVLVGAAQRAVLPHVTFTVAPR